eukprot:COSAG05_NODE_19593_length_290_cov_0.921466_2_plen_36_part_01
MFKKVMESMWNDYEAASPKTRKLQGDLVAGLAKATA